MDFAFTAEAGLAGLFLASFLSATLLPGGSEAVLFAVIRLHPEQTLPALLLAWAPIVGDALCAAAGWLRLPTLACAAWMAAGKAGRYVVVVAGAGMV